MEFNKESISSDWQTILSQIVLIPSKQFTRLKVETESIDQS